MYWMRSSALTLGNSGVYIPNKAVCILKQKENNLFPMTDWKQFVACGFHGVKISPVIGCNTINIPDIFQVFTPI